jgi:hypothetical protein
VQLDDPFPKFGKSWVQGLPTFPMSGSEPQVKVLSAPPQEAQRQKKRTEFSKDWKTRYAFA